MDKRKIAILRLTLILNNMEYMQLANITTYFLIVLPIIRLRLKNLKLVKGQIFRHKYANSNISGGEIVL